MNSKRVENPSQPMSFALLSPSGWGNLGDAAIVEAVIEQIRRRFPEARIVGLTLNPDDTLQRHGLQAMTLRGFSSHGYGIRETSDRKVTPTAAAESPSASGPVIRPRSGIPRLLDLATRPIRRPLYNLRKELKHIRRSRALLKSIDTLVICGGGQLDDYWGGPWGHPYVLFRWGLLARRAGVRVVVLGVGTGSLKHAVSHFFVRRFLTKAEFRSYRDAGSRDLLGAPRLTATDTIGPDLAFALNVSRYKSVRRTTSEKLHVAVSPMSWLDPRIWPEKDQQAYDRYVALLAEFTASLCQSRHQVSLFATDDADERTIADVIKIISTQFPQALHAVERPVMGSVKNLLTLLADSDLVVASRLHGVLLSCVMEIPTLALSYDRKVTALMGDMKLVDYCGELATMDQPTLSRLFEKTLAERNRIASILHEQVGINRQLLDHQFNKVFGPVPVNQGVQVNL